MVLSNFNKADIRALQKIKYGDKSAQALKEQIGAWSKKEYNGKYFEMLAVRVNDALAGEASLYERSAHIVSCGIEVYPAFRRKGHGAQAYEQLLLLAKGKGYTVAVAQVSKENVASIALHRKMGFEAEEYVYLNQKGENVYYFIKAL